MHWRSVHAFRHEDRTLLVNRPHGDSDRGQQFVLVHGIGVASRYSSRLARVLAVEVLTAARAIDLRAPGSLEGVRFPRRQDGHARLSGTRVLQADNKTLHEEVDVSGELETLAVKSIGVRGTHDSDACVTLGFDVPLQGRAVRTLTAPGISKEEAIYPSALVTSSYSALSPRSFGDDDHRFLDTAFSICTGPELEGQGVSSSSPRGLTISPDSRLWQRSGRWSLRVGRASSSRMTATLFTWP